MKLTPLTKRDAWSATFEHVLDELDSPREDCPMHLPSAPSPTIGYLEAEAPIHDLQSGILFSF
jgi:phospholipase C